MCKKKKRTRHDTWVLSCGGIAGGALYYAPDLGVLVWLIMIIPFYWMMDAQGGRADIRRASLFVFPYLLTSYLMGYSIDVGFSSLTGILVDTAAVLGVSLFQGIPLVVLLVLAARLPCVAWFRTVMFASFWALGEWLQEVSVFAFPVRSLAASLWSYDKFLQFASVCGELGVSFVIALFAALVAYALQLRRKTLSVTARSMPMIMAVVLFASNAIFSFIWQAHVAKPADYADIYSVQPQTTMTDYDDVRFDTALELASEALADRDVSKQGLLVFPESTAQYLRARQDYMTKLGALAIKYKLDIIVGGVNVVADDDIPIAEGEGSSDMATLGEIESEGRRENAVHLIRSDGKLADEYYVKQHLVPIFENGYIYPFSLKAGKERDLMDTSLGKLGVLICFESTLPDAVRNLALDGARMIAVPSNDAYLGDVIKINHFAESVFRSLETYRVLVYSSTDGVTGATFPDGRYEMIPLDHAGVFSSEIGLFDAVTPYMIIGEAWIGVLIMVCIIASIYARIRQRGSDAG